MYSVYGRLYQSSMVSKGNNYRLVMPLRQDKISCIDLNMFCN
jgi:hypothetical protein